MVGPPFWRASLILGSWCSDQPSQTGPRLVEHLTPDFGRYAVLKIQIWAFHVWAGLFSLGRHLWAEKNH